MSAAFGPGVHPDAEALVERAKHAVTAEMTRRLLQWAKAHPECTEHDLEHQADLIAEDLIGAEFQRLLWGRGPSA